MTTPTVHHAATHLVVGMTNRYLLTIDPAMQARQTRAASDAAFLAYTAAAQVALPAMGCTNVPAAPFGLQMIVQVTVDAHGARPPATAPASLAAWRDALTASILAQII